mgnify:CR=1 FL=1
MELKNFIISTVSEIIEAIKELQTKYTAPEVLINPDIVYGEKGSFWIGKHSIDNISKRRIQEIKIKASLEVTDSETSEGGAGINISALQMGGKKGYSQNESENSYIEFDIPIALPTVSVLEYLTKIKK